MIYRVKRLLFSAQPTNLEEVKQKNEQQKMQQSQNRLVFEQQRSQQNNANRNTSNQINAGKLEVAKMNASTRMKQLAHKTDETQRKAIESINDMRNEANEENEMITRMNRNKTYHNTQRIIPRSVK